MLDLYDKRDFKNISEDKTVHIESADDHIILLASLFFQPFWDCVSIVRYYIRCQLVNAFIASLGSELINLILDPFRLGYLYCSNI